VVAFVPRLPAASRAAIAGDRLIVVNDPVHLASACEQAALVVCHGGAGVTAACLQAAAPMLLLPMHMEQLTSARRLAALGVATVVPTPLAGTALSDWVAKAASALITGEAVRGSAQAASRRISTLNNEALLDAIAQRCDALMADRD
jgi:UDP:flavonoid glycosyltransferase YjiC (YdhE family)